MIRRPERRAAALQCKLLVFLGFFWVVTTCFWVSQAWHSKPPLNSRPPALDEPTLFGSSPGPQNVATHVLPENKT